jgi:integrase
MREKKTLRIACAAEETKAFGRTLKEPKTSRGRRTIQIDDALLSLLLTEREKHLRIAAGIPDGISVDLSLVKLPEGALMFPSNAGETFDFTRLRDPHAVTREFCRQARKRGFLKLRFHDLRGSHETALLYAGVPVHVVVARCGHAGGVAADLRQADPQGGHQRCRRNRRNFKGDFGLMGPTWVQSSKPYYNRSRTKTSKPLKHLAGVERLELPTPGFGDRCSTN